MPIDWSPEFRAARWLSGAHAQTIWPALFRRVPPVPRRRERIGLPDGDFLDLDWQGEEGAGSLVLIVHGLTGSARSAYVRGLQGALTRKGFRTVALNFRGCSGVMNDTWRCYHSGETGDLDFVFRLLRSRAPATPIGVVGFSLGGNVVLKWLGEQGGAIDVMSAVAVSVPMVLEVCATRMDQGFSRWYRNRLIRELKHYLSVKRTHLRAIGRVADAARIEALGGLRTVRSFWEYDDLVVAGLYAFDGVQDYYARSSSRQYLKSIATPTLVIQAVDDPFMTPEVIPEASELSDHVRIEACSGGGHVGFIGGADPGHPQYWLEQRIPDFLAECKSRRAPRPLPATASQDTKHC